MLFSSSRLFPVRSDSNSDADSNSNSNSNSDPAANSYSDADPISDAVSDPDSGRRADGEGRHCDHAAADGPAVSM